ncbi:Protein transport protein SEC16A-like [Porphyridium purpureum]|uniref:Protein transport protein SEC16A-like n=1 Tax=Porphyridium purpureum TaxID=35688 RepID=A0A5J4YI94_PORPP|nr:Protein transport protein SEC16A-like [Porphyridium purpureum]|eukprot:POR3963..scf251_18
MEDKREQSPGIGWANEIAFDGNERELDLDVQGNGWGEVGGEDKDAAGGWNDAWFELGQTDQHGQAQDDPHERRKQEAQLGAEEPQTHALSVGMSTSRQSSSISSGTAGPTELLQPQQRADRIHESSVLDGIDTSVGHKDAQVETVAEQAAQVSLQGERAGPSLTASEGERTQQAAALENATSGDADAAMQEREQSGSAEIMFGDDDSIMFSSDPGVLSPTSAFLSGLPAQDGLGIENEDGSDLTLSTSMNVAFTSSRMIEPLIPDGSAVTPRDTFSDTFPAGLVSGEQRPDWQNPSASMTSCETSPLSRTAVAATTNFNTNVAYGHPAGTHQSYSSTHATALDAYGYSQPQFGGGGGGGSAAPIPHSFQGVAYQQSQPSFNVAQVGSQTNLHQSLLVRPSNTFIRPEEQGVQAHPQAQMQGSAAYQYGAPQEPSKASSGSFTSHVLRASQSHLPAMVSTVPLPNAATEATRGALMMMEPQPGVAAGSGGAGGSALLAQNSLSRGQSFGSHSSLSKLGPMPVPPPVISDYGPLRSSAAPAPPRSDHSLPATSSTYGGADVRDHRADHGTWAAVAKTPSSHVAGQTAGHEWSRTEPHAIVQMGFNGRVVILRPAATLSAGLVMDSGGILGSPPSRTVRVASFASLISSADDEDLQVVQAFVPPGNNVSGTSASRVANANSSHSLYIALCEQMSMWGSLASLHAESRRALWRILKVYMEEIEKKDAAGSDGENAGGVSEKARRMNERLAAALSQAAGMRKPFFNPANLSQAKSKAAEEDEYPNPLQPEDKEGPISLAPNTKSLIERRSLASQVAELVAGGRPEAALDTAIKHSCWDLALALAASLGGAAQGNVLKLYAERVLNKASCLHSLVCAAAGPGGALREGETAAVKEFDAQRWRWEAACLVQIADVSRRRKGLQDLAEQLALLKGPGDLGNVFAAHVCHLLADGDICKTDSSRFLLVGSDTSSFAGRRVLFGSATSVCWSLMVDLYRSASSSGLFSASLAVPTGIALTRARKGTVSSVNDAPATRRYTISKFLLPFCLPMAVELMNVGKPAAALDLVVAVSSNIEAIFASREGHAFTPPFLAQLQEFEARLRHASGIDRDANKAGGYSSGRQGKFSFGALGGRVSKLFAGSEHDTLIQQHGQYSSYAAPAVGVGTGSAAPKKKGWDSIVASAVGALVSNDNDAEEDERASAGTAFGDGGAQQPGTVGRHASGMGVALQDCSSVAGGGRKLESRVDDYSQEHTRPGQTLAHQEKGLRIASPTSASSTTPAAKEQADNGVIPSASSWGNLLANATGNVGSKFLSIVGPKQAHLGEKENKFYYNTELGQYVVRGEEDKVRAESVVAPPPKDPIVAVADPVPRSAAPRASGQADSTKDMTMGLDSAASQPQPPPPHGVLHAPPVSAAGAANRFAPRTRNPRTRYVDTLAPGSVPAVPTIGGATLPASSMVRPMANPFAVLPPTQEFGSNAEPSREGE